MDTENIINKLGGSSKVAQICEINVAAVSQWKKNGRIPKGWLRFFQSEYPLVFETEQARKGKLHDSSSI